MSDTEYDVSYMVCDQCNNVLANADTSGIDDQDELATIEASIEAMGIVVPTGESQSTGYFDCWVCNEVHIGPAHIWEGN